MTEVGAVTETTNDLNIDNLIDQVFPNTEVQDGNNDTKGHSNDEEDDSLYKLLDEISGARKLMSCIFGPSPEINLSIRDNKITARTLQIGEEWYNQEHIVTNQTVSARALRSDTPVYFSWSHDNKQNSRPSSPTKKPDSGSNLTLSVKETNEQTVINNQRLMGVVEKEMKSFKGSPYSWDNILDTDSSEPLKIEGKIETNVPIENTVRTVGSNTNFKVNPFATFVAHELPKPKKQEKKSDSKVHHSKSKLWFWGSKKSKKKSKDKKKNEENKEEDVPNSKNAENSIVVPEYMNMDIDNMEAKSINSRVSRTTSIVLNELLDEDPIGHTDSNSVIDYLQASDNGNNLELQLTNTNIGGLDKSSSSISGRKTIGYGEDTSIDDLDKIGISTKLDYHESAEQKKEPIMERNSESDSDDDFGNFEQAAPNITNSSSILDLPPPPVEHPVSQIYPNQEQIKENILQEQDENEPSLESGMAQLTMNSFVPLQPSKK